MRLDKYLKNTRLIKRRTVAKVLIDEGNILVNNKVAKPSYEVNVGDFVQLKLGLKIITIQVFKITENSNKIEAKSAFKIVEEKLTTK